MEKIIGNCFISREGIRPIDFMLPDRIAGSPPLEEEPLKGKSFPLEPMVKLLEAFRVE